LFRCRQLPWLCFSEPVLKSHEYKHFEVRQAARVMWFERLFVWTQLLERCVLLPLVFLAAITIDADAFKVSSVTLMKTK
jgi:hypothetical protein